MAGSGRNDAAIANDLTAMAQVLAQANENVVQGQQHQSRADELRLDRLMRNHPPTFKGRYDPKGAQTWLYGIERIFRAMVNTDNQKVRLGTRMLVDEVEFWWMNSKRRLEAGNDIVSWEKFKEKFLRNQFPADVRNKKEIEFLELKQGSMSVAEYAAKFQELSQFCPYINEEGAEQSKFIKFDNVLRPEIYQYVGFHEIRDFATLVNKCQIFYAAGKVKASLYKILNDRKGKEHDLGNPYGKDKGKKKDFGGGSKPSGGDLKCFKCGGMGDYANDCKGPSVNFYNCGRIRHQAFECKSKQIVSYNCGDNGHVSTKFTKPKKEKAGGKVFALNVEEGPKLDNMIRGIFFINRTPLIAIIDTSATHSFIYVGCVERLNLVMSPLSRGT